MAPLPLPDILKATACFQHFALLCFCYALCCTKYAHCSSAVIVEKHNFINGRQPAARHLRRPSAFALLPCAQFASHRPPPPHYFAQFCTFIQFISHRPQPHSFAHYLHFNTICMPHFCMICFQFQCTIMLEQAHLGLQVSQKLVWD